jgi:hypothetical protein
VAIASGLPYADVYAALADGNARQRVTRRTAKTSAGKRTANHGIYTQRKWFKDYMAGLDFAWTPTMTIGSGCKVHLTADELPNGVLILALSKHVTTMIDGIIHDTYDPRRPMIENGKIIETRCVYGYWRKE